ncbi:MAG: hypothetical protein ACOCRK_05670 [bacterium]
MNIIDITMNLKKDMTIVIDIDDYPEYEFIIVKNKNLTKKREYIDKTYDDNLKHKYSNGVKIHDVIMC